MTLQEILDRVQNVLYQGVDTESQDLDLLRHDLENAIIDSSIDESVSAEIQWRKQSMVKKVDFGRREEDKIKQQFNRECG